MRAHENTVDSPSGLGFPEFPTPSRDEWRSLVTGVLRKGGLEPPADGPVEQALTSTTYDGLEIAPLYDTPGAPPGYPGLAPFTRGASPQGFTEGWDIRQWHAHPDAETARDAIRADLEGGVTSVWLAVGPGGIPATGIETALTDVDLDVAPVTLSAGAAAPEAAEALLRAYADHGLPEDAVRGNLGLDPLTVAATSGATGPGAHELADTAALAAGYARRYPQLHTIAVDARAYHDAGASEGIELGAALASGITYLRLLTHAGLDLATAARQLEFRFAASADQFLTIAKLRAARTLWHRVTEACGLAESERGMRQHAVTSRAMLTRRAPYVNIPRTTVACLAAAVGGATAITVHPFDSALGRPSTDGYRIARNVQALLLHESGMARVIDPAGGSGYVEQLTSDLADSAWQVMQRIEAAGGMPEALSSGQVTEMVHTVWEQRRDHLAHRRDPITGVSAFPELAEALLERDPAPEPTAPDAILPLRRYAADFEELRDRAENHQAATGHRPAVFLATLGPQAGHTARATEVANLLAAGGIDTIPGGELTSAAAAAEGFAASGTRIACLCGSDAAYAELATDTVAALRAAGANTVLVAGHPDGPGIPEDTDGHVHAAGAALELLRTLHTTLGVDT
ncbi:methylmalonyl-CoA mutase family protein [Lipingzhangella sp. LS1_29]|uniref:Methylmalonyl-CoA mutase family protein n=1 Tax=Lipingzhangella rawalii TaxID=2055835 RepID=A0ABU2H470_9ACTN|nr:methylmalonyl-CoA mutase family protein [Lipingzhangella rawalii]MDS1270103.1 methylmalonyl-CoA mutase family protein [Lipingzhangella rawalii]